jgi:hypothetical protein
MIPNMLSVIAPGPNDGKRVSRFDSWRRPLLPSQIPPTLVPPGQGLKPGASVVDVPPDDLWSTDWVLEKKSFAPGVCARPNCGAPTRTKRTVKYKYRFMFAS